MPDSIHIAQLELSARIGVPEEERAVPQRLTVNLTLELVDGFEGMGDDLDRTVDYFRVSKAVQALAAHGARQLIETLATEIADLILAQFPLAAVEVELRKYILPDTEFVAVRLRRERNGRKL